MRARQSKSIEIEDETRYSDTIVLCFAPCSHYSTTPPIISYLAECFTSLPGALGRVHESATVVAW
jgi:hypothetical protein